MSLSLTNAGNASQTSLKLLNQTVLDALNKQLEADFGDNAIQRAYEQGLNVTPQCTADRIVQGATAFFDRFSEKYTDLAEPERLDKFLETISAGIERGFAEARDILSSLDVLKDDISDNIDQTFNLVQQGLDNFRARYEPVEDN